MSDVTLTRDKVHPSLAGTGTAYVCAQVRLVDANKVRYQCSGAEWTYNVTPDVAKWLAAQPAPWGSTAGTSAKYTPCLIRPEDASNQRMRVQVPGAQLNREWGAEFIHNGPCSPAALAVLAAAGQPAEAPLPAPADDPKPDPVDYPTDEDEDEPEPDEDDADPDDDDEEEDETPPSDKVPF